MHRSAQRVLLGAALTWIGFSGIVLGWILVEVATAGSEHMAGDWTLALLILSPVWLLSALAFATLVVLLGEPARAPWFGLVWGLGGSIVGGVALLPLLDVIRMGLIEGGRLAVRLTDPIVVGGNPLEGTYYKYWIDLLPAIWFVSAVVGLVASMRLIVVRSAGGDGESSGPRA